MKHLLEVCLVALASLAGSTRGPSFVAVQEHASAAVAAGFNPAGWDGLKETSLDSGLNRAPQADGSPPKQQGISVELPLSSGATPVPRADRQGALIVTLTYDGRLYFGVEPVMAAALPDKIRRALSDRQEEVYIKADGRAPYADLVKVLDAAHAAGVKAITLLTTGHESPGPNGLVPPNGFELLVVPRQ